MPPIGNWRVVPKPANYQLAARPKQLNYNKYLFLLCINDWELRFYVSQFNLFKIL